MDSTFKAALQAGGALIFDALKLVYPGGDYRVISAGFATIGSELYEADAHGFTLSSVEEYSDGGDNTAPRCKIVLLSDDYAVLTALGEPETQWSRVYAWWGAIDPATGVLIGEAERPFLGRTDVADYEITEDGWSLTLDCASGLDQALDYGEGQRYSDAFHQKRWPGELGCEFMTGLVETVWWGTNPPRGTVTGGGGGGTGFIGRLLNSGPSLS